MPPEIIVILVLAGIMFVLVILIGIHNAITIFGDSERELKETKERYAKALMKENPNLTERQARSLARKKYPRSAWFAYSVEEGGEWDRHIEQKRAENRLKEQRRNVRTSLNYERAHLINQGKYDEAYSLDAVEQVVDELLRK